LRQRIAEARAAWPGIAEPDGFERFVAERAHHVPLDELEVESLYLACACAAGDAAALAMFAQRYEPVLRTALSRVRGATDLMAETLQRVRVRLFVGDRKILAYSGRGDLGRWLRTVAVREALAIAAAARRERPLDDDLVEAVLPARDPTLDAIKRAHRGAFASAVRGAFASLPVDERTRLHAYYVDGLGLDQIAAAERVSASTISRRLAAARATLAAATRDHLTRELGLRPGEVDSVVRAVQSQLELSRDLLPRR
jgi:RNA polymerase sigma-70 factor (ECF subfamily)